MEISMWESTIRSMVKEQYLRGIADSLEILMQKDQIKICENIMKSLGITKEEFVTAGINMDFLS